MKQILLDHCVPVPLRTMLSNCDVFSAGYLGWDELKNGKLLEAAEKAGFDIMITSDKNLRYQQNLTSRKIAIIELPTNLLRKMPLYVPEIQIRISLIQPGAYEIIS
ncbi:MAG: hypothetical protein WCT04_11330 [Planctomycetota bacterium]